MKLRHCALLVFFLPLPVGACNSGKQPSEASAGAVRAEDLVGKWRLIRAGGRPPAELQIRSQEIDIAPDGTWTSKIEFGRPEQHPTTFNGRGTWSLSGARLGYRYTPAGEGLVVSGAGPTSGTSAVRLESGRLVVDPDFFMQVRESGTTAVAGEYQR